MKLSIRTSALKTIQSLLRAGVLLVALSAGMHPLSASAQVLLAPAQLDQIVARIALYPDPLLAQVLPGSTYSEQIADAADWADAHSYLTADSLAAAINDDHLPWDPSVLALLPFPTVLDMMATNIFWTRQLGDAVLGQRADVMDAVQRMRKKAYDFGYLQNSQQYRLVISGPGIIEIVPADPAFYFLPVYDPLVVFVRPRAGLAAGITFNAGIHVGAAFATWGWRDSGFGWSNHSMVLDGKLWVRNRENHETYSHPYTTGRQPVGPRVENHEVRPTRPTQQKGRSDKDKEKR